LAKKWGQTDKKSKKRSENAAEQIKLKKNEEINKNDQKFGGR
jgi:hypothetical protein